MRTDFSTDLYSKASRAMISVLAMPETVARVDVRERSKYDAGHIPGADWLDHAAWTKRFGDG